MDTAIEFPRSYEETLALIEERGNKEEKEFAKLVSGLTESADPMRLRGILKDICYPSVWREHSDLYPFVFFELLHLKMGSEFMRRMFAGTNIFFDFCDDSDAEDVITDYFLKLGMERDLYLSEESEPDEIPRIPLWCIRDEAWSNRNLHRLKKVPKHIIAEAFTLRDYSGDTILHMGVVYEDPPRSSTSFFEVLKYLSGFEGYEETLLKTNNAGATPLYHNIGKCSCIDTIKLMIATPEGKKAASMRTRFGETAYELMCEAESCYKRSLGENVNERLVDLLDELEDLNRGMTKCCRG